MKASVRKMLVSLLILGLVFPPNLLAGGITADPNAVAGKRPGVGAAQNGVPVVNITNPSKSGVSHNQYQDFNVGKGGAILNNSRKAGQSQLGGAILGNPNLTNGSAKLILNEVTSANRSHIQGYIEVHGQKADVILANPNGVTVNGGGFLNVGRGTVTTGRPDVDAAGALQGFDVRQGDVRIEGQGVNASNLTGFDIVARAAEINAEIYAQDLSIVTGQNRYNPATRTATPLADDGSGKPRVAIDSTALGGMYAGRIKLTSTEKGVGVNLQGVMQSTGNLEITADGQLLARAVKSDADMQLTSVAGDVQIEQMALAGKNMKLSGQQTILRDAYVAAGNNLELEAAGTIAVDGSSVAGNNLSVKSETVNLANQAVLSGNSVQLAADNLEINNATLQAENTLAATVGSLNNNTDGRIYANTDLRIEAESFTNAGEVASNGGIALSGNSFKNIFGKVLAGGDINLLSSTLLNQGDNRASASELILDDMAGVIYSGGNIRFAGEILTLNGGLFGSDNRLQVNAADLQSGNQALLYAANGAEFATTGDMLFNQTRLDISGNLGVNAANLALIESTMLIGGVISAALHDSLNLDSASTLAGYSGLSLSANNLTNRGFIYSGTDAVFYIQDTLSNLDGADILAEGTLWFAGLEPDSRMNYLHNQSSNIESLNGGISISADRLLNDGGSTTFKRVKEDYYEYVIFGWHGDFTPPYSSDTGSYNPALVTPYDAEFAYSPEGNKNYLIERRKLNKYSGGHTLAYLAEQERLHGLPADTLGTKYEGFQEWKEFYHDEPTSESESAFIMSAGDMLLDVGELVNNLSTLSAGGNMSIIADKLTNMGVELSRYTEIERYFISTGSSGTYRVSGKSGYYTLADVYSSIPGVISATGQLTLDVAESFGNSGSKSGMDYDGRAGGTPAFDGFEVTGNADMDNLHPGVSGLPNLNLPAANGVFSLAANSDHNYLIESNPAFADMGRFYGSDYFLSHLGYDFEREQTKLLGDAYYETRLVRDQMLAQTGQRYLFEGVTDDAETMRRLMDNAALEGASLGLAVGVALSPEQIQWLTKDIIWLEEMDYNGQTVLVPRLYLCEATLADVKMRGAIIAGNDVSMNYSGSAPLSNSGLITGNLVQLASSADILNKGGEIFGKNALLAQSDGSIINRSGRLGGGDIILAAGKNIVVETAMRTESVNNRTAGGSNNGNRAIMGQVGAITATGNITMQSGNDIKLAGGNISGQGQTVLQAENDVVLGGKTAVFNSTSTQGYHSFTAEMGSGVSGQDVDIFAGNDVTLAGSRLAAEDSATVTAGNNLVIGALEGGKDSYWKQSHNGSWGSSGKEEIERHSTGLVGSSIEAGGNLSLIAGADAEKGNGNITMQASQATAGGDVSLKATGDVILANGQERNYDYYYKSSKSMLKSRAEMRISDETTSVGSLVSGNNVSIQSKDNVLIAGSAVKAENDLAVRAESGDVVVAAAQDTYFGQSQKKSSGFNFGNLLKAPLNLAVGKDSVIYSAVDEKSKNQAISNAGSALSAGNNLSLEAGRDVSVIGSLVEAGNDIDLAAGRDVNLIPGQEKHASEYSKKKTDVGLWSSLGESGISLFAGVKSETEGIETVGEYNAGSLISADRDVVIGAGRDINQTTSQIEAGRDAIISAGRDWNMLAAQDYDSLHQYVKSVQGGISASVTQNVSGATRNLVELPHNAMQGKGNPAFQGLTAGSAYLRTVDSLKAAASNPISASASVGGSFSRTDYQASSSTARPSAVLAERDVEVATGRDINIVGGKVASGQNVIMDAGRDLNITAALNHSDEKMSSSSGGASVGVKSVVGSGSVSFGVNAQANAAGSASDGKGTSHTNSQITAGDTFYGLSGRDTSVIGGKIEADRVWLDTGGDLTVASVQDSYESQSNSWSAGADATVGYGANVNVSLGYGQGSGTSDWVGEQTAIVGHSEVDIYVEDNTHLKGAIIATDKGGDLTLDTGGLTYESIKDKDKSGGWNAGVSMGVNLDGGFDKPENSLAALKQQPNKTGEPREPSFMHPMDFTSADDSKMSDSPYTPNSLEFGYSASDKRGILRPTITDGEIIVRDDPDTDLSGLNRDIDQARELTRNEDSGVDLYLSRVLLDALLKDESMLREHQEYAQEHKFINPDTGKETVYITNLLPGLFLVPSITGGEYYLLDENLEYVRDKKGNKIKVKNADLNIASSDQNPLLQGLFHLVPGIKSFSEIHDRQMQIYEKATGIRLTQESKYQIVTIPGSFAKSYANSLIGILDVGNWSSNWNNYIKPSYKVRQEPNNRLGE